MISDLHLNDPKDFWEIILWTEVRRKQPMIKPLRSNFLGL